MSTRHRMDQRQKQLVAIKILDRTCQILTVAKWTRHAQARDIADIPTEVFSPDAVQFDLVGAVTRATRDVMFPKMRTEKSSEARTEALMALEVANGGYLNTKWNDVLGRCKEEVLDLIKRARASIIPRAKYFYVRTISEYSTSYSIRIFCTVDGSDNPTVPSGQIAYPISRKGAEKLVGTQEVEEARLQAVEKYISEYQGEYQ